jgi:hypothetical protein
MAFLVNLRRFKNLLFEKTDQSYISKTHRKNNIRISTRKSINTQLSVHIAKDNKSKIHTCKRAFTFFFYSN